jgi:hypothetical protein
MSAACAAVAAPRITTANKNRRIATLHHPGPRRSSLVNLNQSLSCGFGRTNSQHWRKTNGAGKSRAVNNN